MNRYFVLPPIQLEEQVLPEFRMLKIKLESSSQVRIQFKGFEKSFKSLYYSDSNQNTFEKALKTLNSETVLVMPYFDPKQLDTLQQKDLNGFDLSGNAVLTAENWSVHTSGEPNRFRQAITVLDPYQGRAGLVTRALLKKPNQTKLDDIYKQIQQSGGQISQSLVSRTIQALEQDYIIKQSKRWRVQLIQPDLVIQKLIQAWSNTKLVLLWRGRVNLPKEEFLPQIFQNAARQAVMTGIGSIQKYTNFSNEQTVYIYGQQPDKLLWNLPHEQTERFVNLEIRYCKEPGVFFDSQIDENGIVWASPLQTVIEAKNADARLQEAVEDLKNHLIAQTKMLMLEA